jgi:peptide/nickel transport system ATP-binding protein
MNLLLQEETPLLTVEDLVVEFPVGGGRRVHAVSGVSFAIAPGETLGLVGESGCGKSSLARAIMQVPPPTSGRVLLEGVDLARLGDRVLRELRGSFQMVFQDPLAALNPVRSVGESVELPLRGGMRRGADRQTLVCEALAAVGIDPEQYAGRKPAELSGGQCQRVCIARALITRPKLLLCDEPVASLDVSIQAQIVNLLHDLKKSRGLALLFISHDLAVVKNIADRVAVMYLGRLCESAPCEALYAAPRHPYTRLLLDAVPRPDPAYVPPAGTIPSGELPSAMQPPSGCRFRTRCPRSQRLCAELQPELRELGPGHQVACHFPLC